MFMYKVWDERFDMPKADELKQVKCEHITIKPFEPEKDGYVFLHGLAIVKFKERFYCAWAHNKDCENSDSEVVNYAYSDDNGITWSRCIEGDFQTGIDVGVSHGTFLVHNEKLYFFAPQFKGRFCTEMLKMSAYVLDEESNTFKYMGIALNDRFWPMCEPQLMDNGNYVMPGIYVGFGFEDINNTAAVAISHGTDVLNWDIVKIPKEADIHAWGECTVIINGCDIRLYCRDAGGNGVALYSQSNNYAKNWSNMNLSNLSMIDSKPYSGTLSNGRSYLICSCAKDICERNPLTIALTEKGGEKFNKIYTIDFGSTLSYPYAIEIDKKLYVAYSKTNEGYNRNSAELAIINIEDLV